MIGEYISEDTDKVGRGKGGTPLNISCNITITAHQKVWFLELFWPKIG